MAPVPALASGAAQSLAAWPSPTRGVANATLRLRPRRVSETPRSAAAASAAVMPGTTSNSTPAARSASISSCARPNSIGSPPFSRTTTACFRAASTSRLLMNACAVEWRPQRLPTATFSARSASASISGCTSASWKTMSAAASSRAARTVSRSGAPGPAPTRKTLPGVPIGLRGRGQPAPEERERLHHRALVRVGQLAERRERRRRILVVPQRERVEAAALEEEQLVAQHVADRAQLAFVPVAVAQQPPGREAAAVAEFREVHGDEREVLEVRRDRFRPFVGGEPHADRLAAVEQVLAAQAPERERDDQPARGREVGHEPVLADGDPGGRVVKQPPAVACDLPVPDQRCHRRSP